VRESIHQSLEREANFTVVGEAGDGEEAVRMARELKPDVIVMDISLPKINGIEATKQIKAFQPSVIVLGLTAYDYEQYIFPLLDAGAAGYLLKDISSASLSMPSRLCIGERRCSIPQLPVRYWNDIGGLKSQVRRNMNRIYSPSGRPPYLRWQLKG